MLMSLMSPSLAVYLFVSVTCGFVIKGLAGFGDPLISNPLLAMRLPNSVITPGMLPVSLVLNIQQVVRNRKSFSLPAVLPIAIWVLLGIIPGTLLLKMGSVQKLKVVLGLLIIGLGVEMLTRRPDKKMKPNAVVRSVLSFFSGVTAGLFGINLLFLAYLERTSEDRSAFRVNVCFVFALEGMFRGALYAMNGMFDWFTLQLTLITLPGAFLGMLLGGLLDRRINDRHSRKIIIYVFILGGVSTLVNALLSAAAL